MLPGAYQLPTGVLLMIVGLLACFAGYRLFRIVLTIYGFLLGALLASTLVHTPDTAALIVTLLVGGVFGAAILWFGYFVGVALAGGAFGAIVAQSAWTSIRGSEPGVLILAFAAILGGALAVGFQRYFVILATAFIGAETAVAGLVSFLSRHGDGRLGFENIWVGHLAFPAPGRRWTFIAWTGLGLVGAVVQFYTGTRRRSWGKKARNGN